VAGGEEHIVRRLLIAVENDSAVSQRSLSRQMGIALGSVNWYLNRCIRKGLIKFHEAPAKRYLYYLTPRGFDEKARLSAAFLRSSFELFRAGRKECAAFFRACSEAGRRRIFLAGDGDFAEIAVLSSFDAAAKPIGVIDPVSRRMTCAGLPVVNSLEAATALAGGPPEAVLLTDLDNPKCTYEALTAEADAVGGLDSKLVTIPKILNFRRAEP